MEEEQELSSDEGCAEPALRPRPPSGADRTGYVLEALRRLGIDASELEGVTKAQLMAQGMSEEAASRKAMLKERSRIQLLSRVEQEVARVSAENAGPRKHYARSRPQVQMLTDSKSGRRSLSRDTSVMSFNLGHGTDESDGTSEDSDAPPDSKKDNHSDRSEDDDDGTDHPRKKKTKDKNAGIFVLTPNFFKPKRSPLKRYLANGAVVTKEMTLTQIAGARLAISKGNVTQKLKMSISRKTEDLLKEQRACEEERARLQEAHSRRRAQRAAQRDLDQKRVERMQAEEVRKEALREHHEMRQREAEARVVENEKKRKQVAQRRCGNLVKRAREAQRVIVMSHTANGRNKQKQLAQDEVRARESIRHEEEVRLKGSNAVAERADHCHDNAQAHRRHIEETQERASQHAAWRARQHRLRREGEEVRFRRWNEMCRSANSHLAKSYRDSDSHRKEVYARQGILAEQRRETYDLLNKLSDNFYAEHKKHTDGLIERRLDVISHANEEKAKKAQRARRAQSYREEQIRDRVEQRLSRYNDLVAGLDDCWRQLSEYGQVVRAEESKMRSAIESGSRTKEQLRRLKDISATVTKHASPRSTRTV